MGVELVEDIVPVPLAAIPGSVAGDVPDAELMAGLAVVASAGAVAALMSEAVSDAAVVVVLRWQPAAIRATAPTATLAAISRTVWCRMEGLLCCGRKRSAWMRSDQDGTHSRWRKNRHRLSPDAHLMSGRSGVHSRRSALGLGGKPSAWDRTS
jgi:hypothetical protein